MINQIKYYAVAQVFKLFSSSAFFQKVYRLLANRFGQKKHSILSLSDIEQGKTIRRIIRDYGYNRTGPKVFFELGTGWTHSYAIYLSLFYDSRFILFDIQDNRQFKAFKERTAKLIERVLGTLEQREEYLRKRIGFINELLDKATSFQEIYPHLSMEYLIDSSGSLDKIQADSIDVLFSVDVLEHIPKEELQNAVKSICRILKPGGLTIHHIGLDDHLMHYVNKAISKQYLGYSDRIWETFFNNKIQYFNRLQPDDYFQLFSSTKLRQVFLAIEQLSENPTRLKVDKKYARYNNHQLLTTRLFLACVKE